MSLFLYRVTWCELMPLFPIFAPLCLLDRRPSTFRRSHACRGVTLSNPDHRDLLIHSLRNRLAGRSAASLRINESLDFEPSCRRSSAPPAPSPTPATALLPSSTMPDAFRTCSLLA